MKLTLTEIRDEAKGTKSFFWQPDKTVSFYPGQYFYYTLPSLKYPDPKGSTRHFTISSSPGEGTLLRLTTRIREESGYKKTLAELPVGSVIEGEGPNGTFIFDEKETGPHIFIAGGIGITPYRSMLKYVSEKNIQTPIYLIYSNSIPEEIVFKKELEDLAAAHPNIKLAMTVSKPEESKVAWTGLTGRIDETLLGKLIGDWKLDVRGCTWWLCGPPPMIDAMEQVLGKLKITSGSVRSEKFTGY